MSLANYIIICKTKIDVEEAKSTVGKIAAVSRGAADLVCHIQLTNGDHFTDADAKPISDLQHEMMDSMEIWKPAEAAAKVKEMFKLFYQLEKKFSKPIEVM